MSREIHLQAAANALTACKEKLFSDNDAKASLDELRHAVKHLLDIERELSTRDAEWQAAWCGPDANPRFGPKTPEELRTFRVETERVNAECHEYERSKWEGRAEGARELLKNDPRDELSITCAKCERQAEQRMQIVRLPDRDHAAMALPPGWFFAHTPKGIGHVYLCSRECACWYLRVVCCPEACAETDDCDHTTRDAPESPCTCAEIQKEDPLRHFRECPLREELPEGHPQADRAASREAELTMKNKTIAQAWSTLTGWDDSVAMELAEAEQDRDRERSRREALEREVRAIADNWEGLANGLKDASDERVGAGTMLCTRALRSILDRAAEQDSTAQAPEEVEKVQKLHAILVEIGHSDPEKAIWDLLYKTKVTR